MSELVELNKYMLYPKNMIYCLKEIVEEIVKEMERNIVEKIKKVETVKVN